MHHNIDICHMLAMDINGAKQSVVNIGELVQDAHSKKDRLLGKT